MKLYRSISLLATLAATIFLSANAYAQVIELPAFSRSADVVARPIHVASPDARMHKLANQAFAVHGAYRLVPENQAAYRFRFEPSGSAGITLTINAGSRTVLTETISGSNLRDALMRAADRAVERTTDNLPGFFAGRLAFISDRSGMSEVYIADMLFEEIRQITRDNARCAFPELSPDGSRLLYTTYYRSNSPDIYSIDIATGTRTPFATFKGINISARYSPDGSRIAAIYSPKGNADLFVSMAGNPKAAPTRLTTTAALESGPSFSPDGSRIVYASDAPGRPQLYEMPSSGGSPKRIPTNISGYCAEPDWNPRHSHLILFTVASGKEFEVALWDATTGKATVLTKGPGDAVEPRWVRDGRHALYTERTGTYRRLMLLDTISGQTKPLHNTSLGNTSQAAYAYPAGK